VRNGIEQKIATAYVERGWRAEDWVARLRQPADRCQALHPARAAALRRWADAVEHEHLPHLRTPKAAGRPNERSAAQCSEAEHGA